MRHVVAHHTRHSLHHSFHVGLTHRVSAARCFAAWSVVTVLPTITDCGCHLLFTCFNTILKNAIRLHFHNLCLHKPSESSLYGRLHLPYIEDCIFPIWKVASSLYGRLHLPYMEDFAPYKGYFVNKTGDKHLLKCLPPIL